MKEGAKTILQLADLVLFALKPRGRSPLDEKARGLFTDEVKARLAPPGRGARRRRPTGRPPALIATC